MSLTKATGILAAVAVSLTTMTTMTGAAHAQVQQNFASVTSSGPGASTAFTYTSGVGLSVTPGQESSFFSNFLPTGVQVQPTTFILTGANNIGSLLAPTAGDDIYTQNLTGGTFTLTGGGQTLLTGTYNNSVLTGSITPIPTANASFRTELIGVQYTGGTYFGASGLTNPGSFSFALNAIRTTSNGTVGLQLAPGGTQFASFTAAGTGIFAATVATPNPVPEPSEWLAMGMAATSVGGLMFRARRRKTSLTATAF